MLLHVFVPVLAMAKSEIVVLVLGLAFIALLVAKILDPRKPTDDP
jgi:hypothetical protein